MKSTAGKPATRIKGPNDVRRFVWAKGEQFFYVFVFFNANLCFIAYKTSTMTKSERKTGLRRVAFRAPGKFFFFL